MGDNKRERRAGDQVAKRQDLSTGVDRFAMLYKIREAGVREVQLLSWRV